MILVIDYGVGNLGSVANALKKLGKKYLISGKPSMVKKADVLILPGVGSANAGMQNLRALNLEKVIKEEIRKGKPFLGICLGMQLLFDYSEEGNVDCLAILKGKVKKFQKERKVPQIGWNQVKYQISKIKYQKQIFKMKNLFRNIRDNSYFYFVNSYYCLPEEKSIIVGESEYGERFASVVAKDNIIATQFHPEKSGKVGMQFLLSWSKL